MIGKSSEGDASIGDSAPLAREQTGVTDYQTVREALSTVAASSWYTSERDMCDSALAALGRLQAERDQLRAAVDWAYQAIGALWPNREALDNLSAVRNGNAPPHEWPVVPPRITAEERIGFKATINHVRNQRDQLRADLTEALAAMRGLYRLFDHDDTEATSPKDVERAAAVLAKYRREAPPPFVAIGNDELGGPVGQTATCPNCGKPHPVKFADKVLPDGSRAPSKMLGYVDCGEKSYMVAIDGKLTPTSRRDGTAQ